MLIYYYRVKGRRIYYQDENLAFKNMTTKKVQFDIQSANYNDCFIALSAKGERSLLLQLGCTENRLLNGFMLSFCGFKSNDSSECHSEMNQNLFSQWCQYEVFPAIARTGLCSTIALDRATHYGVLDGEDRYPTTSWNKERLQGSIIRQEGPHEDFPLNWKEQRTKSQLVAEV